MIRPYSPDASGVRQRGILHIDMNAFYCACHAALEPQRYRNRPTAVAGNPKMRHGILVTCSYEARARGVRATMTVAEALRRCPELILIRPDFDLYRAYSARVFSLVREYTPQVEIFSIDECFADVTGSSQFGSPLQIADIIQSRLINELRLPSSIGVGPNKFLAKMASDMKKPLGITELWYDDVERLLWPLRVEEMFGIGKRTAERLHNMTLHTIGDLARANATKLRRSFGVRGEWLIQHANGLDDSPVNPEREPLKSVGHSVTLAEDITEEEEIRGVLLNLADQVGRRVRKHALSGRTIQVTIRFNNMKTITRAQTLNRSTNLTEDIYTQAVQLVLNNVHPGQRIRLLGVSLGQLGEDNLEKGAEEYSSIQLSLFDQLPAQVPSRPVPSQERLRKLTRVTDELRNRYGEDIVIRGRMIRPHESNQLRNKKSHGTSLQTDNID